MKKAVFIVCILIFIPQMSSAIELPPETIEWLINAKKATIDYDVEHYLRELQQKLKKKRAPINVDTDLLPDLDSSHTEEVLKLLDHRHPHHKVGLIIAEKAIERDFSKNQAYLPPVARSAISRTDRLTYQARKILKRTKQEEIDTVAQTLISLKDLDSSAAKNRITNLRVINSPLVVDYFLEQESPIPFISSDTFSLLSKTQANQLYEKIKESWSENKKWQLLPKTDHLSFELEKSLSSEEIRSFPDEVIDYIKKNPKLHARFQKKIIDSLEAKGTRVTLKNYHVTETIQDLVNPNTILTKMRNEMAQGTQLNENQIKFLLTHGKTSDQQYLLKSGSPDKLYEPEKYIFKDAFPDAWRKTFLQKYQNFPQTILESARLNNYDNPLTLEEINNAKKILPQIKKIALSDIKKDPLKNLGHWRKAEKWYDFLGKLDALTPKEKIELIELERNHPTSDGLKTANNIFKHLKLPQDQAVVNYLKTLIPSNETEKEKLLETLEDSLLLALPPDIKSQMLTADAPPPQESACQILCDIRKTHKKWGSRFLNLIGEQTQTTHLPDFKFGITQLIRLFDIRTRTLCEDDVDMSEYHSSQLPLSLRSDIPQAKKENQDHLRKLTDTRIQASLQTRDIIRNLTQAGAISSHTAEKLHSQLNDHDSDGQNAIKRASSSPGNLSSSLTHALHIAQLLSHELEKLPPKEKKKWKGWRESIHKNFQKYFSENKKHLSGDGGSLFSNYAIGMSALAASQVPSHVLDEMKAIAATDRGQCRISYNRNSIGETQEEAVYRSVVFYSALYKHTQEETYRNHLTKCLVEYAKEPWGVIHDKESRKYEYSGHHMNSYYGRGFAGYYFYGTIFPATEALHQLLDSPESLTDKQRNSLQHAKTLLLNKIGSYYDKKLGHFDSNPSELYHNKPAYHNPALGLALVPYCNKERQKQTLPTPQLKPARQEVANPQRRH